MSTWLSPLWRVSARSWKNLSHLTASRAFSVALGLACTVLWTRYVDPEVYGQYLLVISTIAIVSGYCLPGLGESLNISASRNDDGNLDRILKQKILVALLGAGVLAGYSIVFQDQSGLLPAFLCAAALFPLYELKKISRPWLAGKGHFTQLAILRALHAFVSAVALGAVVLMDLDEPTWLVVMLIGPSAMISVLALFYVRGRRGNARVNEGAIKFGYHATAAGLVGPLVLGDRLLISEVLTYQDVATYSIAMIFPTQLKVGYGVLSTMFQRRFAGADTLSDAWQYLKPKLSIVWGAFLLLGLTGFYLIPHVVIGLFSERYAASIPYARYLWVGASILMPFTFLGGIMKAQQVKVSPYLNTIQSVSMVVLLAGLVPFLGIWGAVLARIASAAILSIAFTITFAVHLRRQPVDGNLALHTAAG